MTHHAAPSSFRCSPVGPSQGQDRGIALQNLAKSNVSFRDASRREDAEKLRRAFQGRTQSETAKKGAKVLGVSERHIVNWLHQEHDMPSWAVKAVNKYLDHVERIARKIEGPQ